MKRILIAIVFCVPLYLHSHNDAHNDTPPINHIVYHVQGEEIKLNNIGENVRVSISASPQLKKMHIEQMAVNAYLDITAESPFVKVVNQDPGAIVSTTIKRFGWDQGKCMLGFIACFVVGLIGGAIAVVATK